MRIIRTLLVGICCGVASAATLPELPRIYLSTVYAPPVGGRLWTPLTSSEFQAALNSSALGDIIELQAGTIYTGPFTMPAKTGSQWIYIRSSAYDQLPAPGTRVTPSHAALMPKIVGAGAPVIAVQTAVGAHHYRWVGIEFLPGAGEIATALIRLGTSSETSMAQLPSQLVFDRVFVHGDPLLGGRRGIALNSASTAIIDSYISDWKEEGGDAQAIAGWNGPGPFKLVNNHLEGAAENLLFGGAPSAITGLVPSDIEIRGNYFYKPTAWRTQAWVVKNLFEIKNARRVLVEGNVFQNTWADGQPTAINLKASNPGGQSWVTLADVTFRHNRIQDVSGGIKVCGSGCDGASVQGARLLVSDNLFANINSASFGGSGRFWDLITSMPDLIVDHNTVIHDGDTATVDGFPIPYFVFTNNIAQHGEYGMKGMDANSGMPTLNAYFLGYSFRKNVLVGAPASLYPAENFFPATYAAVDFTDASNGDYRLAAASPYRNAGTDGKDLGADIAVLNAKTACAVSGACNVIPLPVVSCDINHDQTINGADLQSLANAILAGSRESAYELTGDNVVNASDLQFLAAVILGARSCQ